jgi:hypothetical protein
MDLDTEVVRLMRVIEAIRRNGGGAKWMESQTEIVLKNALNVVYTAGYNAARNEGVKEMAKQEIPVCCGRKMEAVISRSTSVNPYRRGQDTPVYWCPDCHKKIERIEEKTNG